MADENKTVLSEDELQTRLSSISGWRQEGKAIVRRFGFENFKDITGFMKHLAATIEAQNHHPDAILDTLTRTVTITVMTHSEGAITQADIDFAEGLNAFKPSG